MNRQKLACIGFVLSIFALLGNARAQDAGESPQARRFNRRVQALLPFAWPPENGQHQTSTASTAPPPAILNSSSPEQTDLPLGSYFGVLPETVPVSGRSNIGGEFELSLLAGGRFRVVRSGTFIDDSGTYSVAGEQIQFNNPIPSAVLGANCTSGLYRWQLQGNRLTLTTLNDPCEVRRAQFATQPFFRRETATQLWRQIGPEGGQINALFASGNNLYAATSGDGVYRSTDNGQTWARSLGISGYDALALTAVGSNLLAGVNFGPIFISTDEGQTWTWTDIGANRSNVRDFAALGTNVFAATEGGGVLLSTNGGRAWTRVNTGLTNLNVYALAVSGTTLLAGTSGGVFRTTDNGQTWTAVNTGLTSLNVRALVLSGTRLLAGTRAESGASEVFVSDNNGDTWRVFGNGLASLGANGGGLEKLRVSGDRVLAAASGGLLINENGTWRRTSFTAPVPALRALAVSGTQLFAGSLFYGVYRSADGGQTWNAANTGLRARSVWTSLKEGGTLYAGLDDGLFATVDEGRNWTRVNLGEETGVYALLSHNNRLFAAADEGVIFSANGQNWTRGMGLDAAVSFLAASGGTLFAATYGDGVFRSTDNGQSWTAVNTGLSNKIVPALAVSGTNVFATTEGDGVFRSTDNGANWTAVNAGLPRDAEGGIYVYALAVNGTNLFAGVIDKALFRSTDNGQTWTRADRGLAPPFYLTLYASGGNLYTSGDAAMGCFRSANNGQDWTPYNTGLDNRFITTFHVSGSTLFGATYGGGLYVSHGLVNRTATVSAASFSATAIADKTIVAAFGQTLATGSAAAASVPLPTTLAGTSVRVRDSLGMERLAPLFFVAATQINYQIPAGTAAGLATITITNADGIGATGEINVLPTAPAIFTATANGTGAAVAVDALTGTPPPFNAKQANGQPNIISLFGTGLGTDATDVEGDVSGSVTASIAGQNAPVLYAGRAPGLVGLNQFNIQLPANIAAGTHTLVVTRDGRTSNSVTIALK